MNSLCVLNENSYFKNYNVQFKSGTHLTKYQKATLHKMLIREETFQVIFNKTVAHTNIGVLSNKVGTGKTLIVLALIKFKKLITQAYKEINNMQKVCYLMFPNIPKDITNLIGEYASYFDFQAFTYSPYAQYKNNKLESNNNYSKSTDIQINSNLIVVSHSLFHQWKQEITNKTDLKVKYISSIRNIDFTKDDIRNGYFDQFDIVLCTANKLSNIYECNYLKFCSLWSSNNTEYVWSRVFIDEADTITRTCNNYFPYLRSHFLWIITASYQRLLEYRKNSFVNDSMRLLRRDVDKNFVEALTITCNENFINKSLNLKPIEYKFKFFENHFLFYFFENLNKDELNECLNSDNYYGALHMILKNHKSYLEKNELSYLVNKINNDTQNKNSIYRNNLIIIYFLQLIHKFIKLRNKIARQSVKIKFNKIKMIFHVKSLLEIAKKFNFYKLLITSNKLCIMCYKHGISKTIINENNFICNNCKIKSGFISFNFSEIDGIIKALFNNKIFHKRQYKNLHTKYFTIYRRFKTNKN